MTSRLLPAAATAAVCIALTGLAIHPLAPHHSTRMVHHASEQAASSAAQVAQVVVPAAQLIGAATEQARELLLCRPETPVPEPSTLPLGLTRGACGRLTVLRAETGPAIDGLGTVLLMGVLLPDPAAGSALGEPIPVAWRFEVSRSRAGALSAQLVSP